MKLKIRYEKTEWSKIRVTIEVIERDDFPSVDIFYSNGDYPADEGFELKKGFGNHIIEKVETAEEAVIWVQKQVDALKKHLNAWRKTQVPEDEVITI